MANTDTNTDRSTNIQLQNLISKLEGLDNANLLQRVSDFLDGISAASDNTQDDNWTPSSEEIAGIKEALKEVEEGKFISLEEAKEQHKQWLK
jgi:hypothetical protein